jgi:hypothetical protein
VPSLLKALCMAFSSLHALHTGHTLVPRHTNRTAPPCLRQGPCNTANLHSRQCSRRQQLLSASTALLYGQLPWQHVSKASATAVYHEVSISSLSPELTVVDEAAEPFEDPPTFVTATGRIVASECRARRVSQLLGVLLVVCCCCWCALTIPPWADTACPW